jgi:hypothetical protein
MYSLHSAEGAEGGFLEQSSRLKQPRYEYESCGDNGIYHAFTSLLAGLEFEDRTDGRRAGTFRNQTTDILAQSSIERRLSILEQGIQSTEEKLLREASSIQAEVRKLDQTPPSAEKATSTLSSSALTSSDLHQQVLASLQGTPDPTSAKALLPANATPHRPHL